MKENFFLPWCLFALIPGVAQENAITQGIKTKHRIFRRIPGPLLFWGVFWPGLLLCAHSISHAHPAHYGSRFHATHLEQALEYAGQEYRIVFVHVRAAGGKRLQFFRWPGDATNGDLIDLLVRETVIVELDAAKNANELADYEITVPQILLINPDGSLIKSIDAGQPVPVLNATFNKILTGQDAVERARLNLATKGDDDFFSQERLATGLAAAEDFTVIALPDTQNYSEYYPEIYTSQTQWILDSTNTLNTEFVTHFGDIVNNAATVFEWTNAVNAMDILDGADMPYGTCVGNHDINYPGDYYDPAGENYLSRFSPDNYSDKSWFGGASPSGLSNYQVITVDGKDYLFMHILVETPPQELAWAQEILNENQIDVKTYSSFQDDYETDDDSQFTLSVNFDDYMSDSPILSFRQGVDGYDGAVDAGRRFTYAVQASDPGAYRYHYHCLGPG